MSFSPRPLTEGGERTTTALTGRPGEPSTWLMSTKTRLCQCSATGDLGPKYNFIEISRTKYYCFTENNGFS